MLPSVIALPPSIDVPRTIAIGLTNTALYRPTRSAAVPRAPSAVIIVIAMAVIRIAADANVDARRVEVNALRFHRGGRSNCRRADKAQGDGSYAQRTLYARCDYVKEDSK